MLNLREAEKIMEQNEQMQPVNVSPKKNSFGNLANFRRNRNGAIFNGIQPDIKKILEEKKQEKRLNEDMRRATEQEILQEAE